MKKLLGIFCLCLCQQILSAQITAMPTTKGYQQLKMQLKQIPNQLKFSEQVQQITLQKNRQTHLSLMQKEQLPMPQAYAYKDLAFFCKIEVQLEKAVKLPVKFRLGSVDYVDYLEGKRVSY